MERRYAAFISYRHAPLDTAVAKRLHTMIEQYQIPQNLRPRGKKKFGPVFRDEEELSLAPDLSEEIRSALDRSEHLIVVCSPRTAESRWVGQEIRYFLKHHDRKKVFLVVAEGEPQKVFPWEVTHVAGPADGTVTEVEPLSANVQADNLRQMRKLLDREILRLFAAMLECSYDDLVQREQKRQRRRIITAASVVLAVALSFSGMLLVKNRQIQQANEELARQKAEVQLRESELLTQNAREALAEENHAAAIEYAVAALPDGDDDRPYYAPAEQALISGLGILESGAREAIVVRTRLEQMTPISNFLISGDGTRVVTFDPYGTLNCYDTQTGKLLWTQQCTGASFMWSTEHQWPLLPLHDGDAFICFGGGELEARDFASGQVLWQAENMTTPAEKYLPMSPDGKLLAYMESDNLFTETSTLWLRILSAETGQRLHSFLLMEDVTLLDMEFATTYESNAAFGAFSADGTLFAGSYLHPEADGAYTLHYYVADLAAGTLEIIRSESMPRAHGQNVVTDITITADNGALLVTRVCEEGSIRGSIEKIDLKTGDAVWKTVPESETEDSSTFYSNEPLQVIYGDGKAFLYRKQVLHAVELDTGEIDWIFAFGSNIMNVGFLQDGILSVIEADGSYNLVWRNESGLYFSGLHDVEVQLGSLQQVQLWNDGFLWGRMRYGMMQQLSIAGTDSRGFVALVPEDDPRQLLIERSKLPGSVVDMLTGQPPGDLEAVYGELHTSLLGDTLYLVPLGESAGEDDTEWFVAADARTLEIKAQFPAKYVWNSHQDVLSDGSGYVFWDDEGEIFTFHAETGEQKTLFQSEYETIFQIEGFTATASIDLSTSARRSSDQALVTARCSGESLTVWTDGTDETKIPLPDGLIWQMQYQNISYNRSLHAGGNGYVVISSFDDETDSLMDGFAAYHTADGSWFRFADAGDGEDGRRYCVGEEQAVFAVADLDGTVRVYDLTSGEVRSSFPLQLPTSSVEQFLFGWNDTLLVVKTEDQQLVIYDAASGAILYRETRDTESWTAIHVYADEKNHRLYLADENIDDHGGLCLDTRSWTKLADISGLLCFDPDSGYLYRYSSTYDYLIRQKIPTTQELVDLAREVLDIS